MSPKHCEFQLIGGIGNQLFILSAALNHIQNGFPSKINISNLKTYGNNHGNSLSDLQFGGEIPLIGEFGEALDSLIFRISSTVTRKIRLKQFGKWQIELGSGYTDISHRHFCPKKHLGYFQSFKFVDEGIKKVISGFEPRAPMQNYLDYRTLADIEKPVVIHIRRGDYFNQMNDLGVLAIEYYKNAISSIRPHYERSNYWIFSNDLHAAAEVGELISANVRVFLQGEDLTDIETLSLMRYGHGHIIANSSFSWWGAFLAKNSKFVVAPQPWFKSQKNPKEIVPPGWQLNRGIWHIA